MQRAKMLKIDFRYADAQSDWKWRNQSCIVRSVEECKRIYGLGKDCKYEIMKITEMS
jgi:hypothetical protein